MRPHVSNKEQVVVCFRWVDSSLESREEFIGVYQVASTAASSLVATIRDVLQRVNVSITKLRGQCYDGASSMSGSRGGVATQLQQEEPRAVYTHCYVHALNLACGDAVKNCKVMRDALDTSYELVKLVKKSPRRDATLQKLKEQMPDDSPGIRVLCPTRWTVRAQALQSIITNYEVLQVLWEEVLDFVKDTEMRSRIQGVASCMTSFDFFLEYHWESCCLSTVTISAKHSKHPVCLQQKDRKLLILLSAHCRQYALTRTFNSFGA